MRTPEPGKDGERMKKSWKKRLAAVTVVLAVGAAPGMTMLRAVEENQEMSGNTGGGYL